MVLQYDKVGDGIKWSIKDAKKYGDALASGLREIGFGPGDSVATRLGATRPEKHCALFAAATAGLTLVSIDRKLDQHKLRTILAEHNCKMLIYDEPDVDVIAAAVPEFEFYNAKTAQPFLASGLPSLRYFVTIALDIQPASHNFQHMLAYQGLPPVVATNDDAPLYVDYASDGSVATFSHAQAAAAAATTFPELDAILDTKQVVF